MKPDESEFSACIEAALKHGDEASMQRCVQQHSHHCYKSSVPKSECFSNEFVTHLAQLIESDDFESSKGKIHIFLFMEYDWSRFDVNQLTRLRDAIAVFLNKTDDKESLFAISELLGEYFDPSSVIDLIKRMAISDRESVRLFVPHALEHMSKRVSTSVPESEMQSLLEALSLDVSESIRHEANYAMKRLR